MEKIFAGLIKYLVVDGGDAASTSPIEVGWVGSLKTTRSKDIMRSAGEREVLGGRHFALGGDLRGQVKAREFLLAQVGELGGSEAGLGVKLVQPLGLSHVVLKNADISIVRYSTRWKVNKFLPCSCQDESCTHQRWRNSC